MLEKIKKCLTQRYLPPEDTCVLAACSGGPDSLTLVHALHCLREAGFWNGELAVAHINHCLRPEADLEAEFVMGFCQERGLVCYQEKVDVRGYLEHHRHSLQEAARILRYKALFRMAANWKGALVATGHHRDDQVETVLLQLFRGAGLDGLKGMRPLQGKLLRPLLAVSRQEIENYCREQGWNPCQDPSNHKLEYLRNRVRQELLPELEAHYNGQIRKTLDRTAMIIGDVQDYMDQQAESFLRQEMSENGNGSAFLPAQPFGRLHLALQRQVIRCLLEKKRGTLTGISFAHVEKIAEMLLHGQVGSWQLLPGGFVIRRDYDGLWAGGAIPDRLNLAEALTESMELVVPGETVLAPLGRKVTARILTELPADVPVTTGVFDLERLKPPLYVRTRQAGDRFEPRGMEGSKKLQDYFTDEKIPRQERDRIPLVGDQDGLLWIGGRRQCRRGGADEHSRQILQLELTRLEDC
ncbi:MAG TPA: tRNA lysidine(34) synthetase TilS [Patescibacteria group bacterium]|nr:tRNA lysidine(34) synthetase TilS [Patescibacteria group bacterium]